MLFCTLLLLHVPLLLLLLLLNIRVPFASTPFPAPSSSLPSHLGRTYCALASRLSSLCISLLKRHNGNVDGDGNVDGGGHVDLKTRHRCCCDCHPFRETWFKRCTPNHAPQSAHANHATVLYPYLFLVDDKHAVPRGRHPSELELEFESESVQYSTVSVHSFLYSVLLCSGEPARKRPNCTCSLALVLVRSHR